MSRLIVKNLPPSITEHKFQSMFEAVGTVTDCKLKYSKNGQFRHFGFVGFRTHQEAEKAVQQFHNTFLNTVRIQVEFCKDLCGKDTPTPWKQKRAKVKELSQTKQKETGKAEKTGKTPAKKEKSQSSTSSLLLGELQDDPEFQEFLQAHQTKATRPTWTDTTAGSDTTQAGSGKPRKTQADKLLFNEEDGDMEEPEGKIEETVEDQASTQDTVSDMEQKGSHIGDSSCSQHMVRMKGVPYKATESRPVTGSVRPLAAPRWERSAGLGCSEPRVVDVGFASEKDQQEALKRDKDYIGTRFIELSPLEVGRGAEDSTEKEHRPWEKKSQEAGDEDESIAESGRLFIRNLPYLCKEEDLEGLFSKYGPLTECHIPIDTFTRRAFGIAFVTFMIPEHAVTAFSQLDGTVFMGRLLHILPARGRGQGGGAAAGGDGDFKKKKEAEQKAKAGSSHNWNSLFLGENAVADVMAERYGTSKSHVLDTESRESLAVRMALGETQIVAETRQFLLDNGVKLDAFSQPAAARSKTVLLVKNLPAGTEASQLQEVFSKASVNALHLPRSLAIVLTSCHEVLAAVRSFLTPLFQDNRGLPLFLVPWGFQSRAVLVMDSGGFLSKVLITDLPGPPDPEYVAESRVDERLEFLDVCLCQAPRLTASRPEWNGLGTVDSMCGGKIDRQKMSDTGNEVTESVQFGQLGRVVLPPAGVTGIVEFLEPSEARTAFYRLAYTKFQHVPLYLEWAPTEIFSTPSQTSAQKQEQQSEEHRSAEEEESDSDEDQEPEERGKCTLFLKNLNFDTTEDTLKQEFSTCGPVRNVSIATKKDMKNPGKVLSMGYGFVEFQKRESAQKALKDLQHCEVDGHRLELKVSNRALQQEDSVRRKPVSKKKQRSSKILVRNIPFQANKWEVQNLFSTFGEIKFVRLPQKFGSTQHRGFGFVEFLSKQDAKRAFNALVHSTHLYGRRLVLEWADTQETVDDLRKKTAEHYHNEPAKKKGKSSMSEGDLITRTQKER
ncbi:putative RNA-binding protein 19 [Branchiostoma belcheri]|nr:putative RNA-binding protein 19 [Branchiostoma belcheri]